MLQKNTFNFLKSLKKNNNKPWFDEHKSAYELAKKDFEQFTAAMIQSLGQLDPSLAILKPKDCIFRIHRDVRFAKDKSPYKVNMGAGFTPGGKKSLKAGYYIHLEPGNCFIGGGVWMPDPEMLKKIRQEIDYNWQAFKHIIHQPAFVKTFADLSGEEKLVHPPKGYEATNEAIEYLKLKSFTVSTLVPDEIFLQADAVSQVMKHCKTMTPFMNFLHAAMETT